MFSKSFRQYALCSKSHKRFIVQVHLCLWSVHKYHNIYIQYHNTKIQYHNTNTTIPLTGHNAIPHIHIQYHNTTHTHTISQYYIYIHMQYQYHNTRGTSGAGQFTKYLFFSSAAAGCKKAGGQEVVNLIIFGQI